MKLHPTILFVHLGTAIPGYLRENILRTRALFKDKKIVLVHDSHNSPSAIAELGAQPFSFEQQSLAKIGIVAPLLGHDSNFWKGYWQNTFNRLFAIGAYQSAHQNEAVIHIESDVVVFPSFPFDDFKKLNKLAWPRVSETHDVASIVYSPSVTEYFDFLLELMKTAKAEPLTTDMLAMSKFSRDFPEKVIALPTMPWSASYRNEVQGDKDAWDLFHGVFDGLTLGHWFTGRDPKNAWGVRRRYLVPLESPLDYSIYRFSADERGCLLLNDLYPVFSLHVHSKNPGYFKVRNKEFIERETSIVNSRADKDHFSLSAFVFTIRTHARDFSRAALMPEKWIRLLKRLREKA